MKKNDELQAKPGSGLLGGGAWYFVNTKETDGEISKKIMDEVEYSDFFRQLNGDGKFVKIGNVHYFWSNIHSFGPIPFEDGVLSQLKLLEPKIQIHIKNRIKSGIPIYTMDSLRCEVSFYHSK